jgi:hypothetical protein
MVALFQTNFTWMFILTVFLASCVVIIVVLLVKFLKSKNIEVGKFRIIGSDGKNAIQGREFFSIIKTIEENTWERFYLIEKEKPKMQMNYAEQEMIKLSAGLNSKYVSLFDKKSLEASYCGDDVVYFNVIVKNAVHEILRYIRLSFAENHFSEMIEQDFQSYSVNKSEAILQMLKDKIELYYRGHFILPISEFFTALDEDMKSIKNEIIDIFQFARIVAIDIDRKVEEKTKKFDSYLAPYMSQ